MILELYLNYTRIIANKKHKCVRRKELGISRDFFAVVFSLLCLIKMGGHVQFRNIVRRNSLGGGRGGVNLNVASPTDRLGNTNKYTH